MCGICGFVNSAPLSKSDFSVVDEMNKALVHRGPDSSGTYRDSHVILAMRRLKIIDLAGGDQPLFNENSSIVLVSNGEIYNHIELREELETRGHEFRTHSDCETIIHLYEEEGKRCVHKLRGMFAFVLYDKKRRSLFIARDRLSEKPLYYYKSDKEMVFSSEMKSLLVYLRKKGIRINPDALNLYFHYQYVPEPLTCIEGVYKLPAAHYMSVSLNDLSFSLEKYWDIEDVEPVYGDPTELISQGFDDLSRVIIRADVPVGIALSGGIDSSAIAVFAAKYYKDKMHAFSVGYPGRPRNDERRMAKSLAKKLGLGFYDIELSIEHLASSFPDLVYYMDDPVADEAAFGYYSVYKLAREHGVPVLLNGFGGDELFWGYNWVRRAMEKNLKKHNVQSLPGNSHFSLSSVLSAYENIRKKGKREMLFNPFGTVKKFITEIRVEEARFKENPGRFIFYDELLDFVMPFNYLSFLYTDDFKGLINTELPYSFFTDEEMCDIPVKICKFLFQTWLYSNSVVLGDRMSMASSVESRLPFLDYCFVELVIGLRKAYGDDYKLGYKKWFIDAMKDIIPKEVLERKKKGFTPPSKLWYTAVVKQYGELCCDGYLISNGVMRKDRVVKFLDDTNSNINKLFFAYKIVLLEIWLRRFVSGEQNV